MRRLLYMVAAMAMVMALTGTSASAWRADREWCEEDPVLHLLGTKVEITTFVNSPASSVTSIAYDITVPSNAGKVTLSYPGGRKVPATVNVTSSGDAYEGSSFTMHVTVTAAGLTDRTVQVAVSGRGVAAATYTGLTNTALSFDIDVTPK